MKSPKSRVCHGCRLSAFGRSNLHFYHGTNKIKKYIKAIRVAYVSYLPRTSIHFPTRHCKRWCWQWTGQSAVFTCGEKNKIRKFSILSMTSGESRSVCFFFTELYFLMFLFCFVFTCVPLSHNVFFFSFP